MSDAFCAKLMHIGLRELKMNSIVSKATAKEVAQPNILGDFVSTAPGLEILHVSSGFGKVFSLHIEFCQKYQVYILPLLSSLANNRTLKSINISSNQLGDRGSDQVSYTYIQHVIINHTLDRATPAT